MKNYIYILFVLCTYPAQAWAQETDVLVWKAHLGIQGSQIQGKDINYVFDEATVKPLYRFHLGLSLTQPVTKHWHVVHELYFHARGAKVSMLDSLSARVATEMQLYYIDVMPISLAYRQQGIQISTGPYLSSLLDAKLKNGSSTKFGENGLYGNGSVGEGQYKMMQKIDWGWQFGAEFKLGSGWFIATKYMLGLQDIFQNANAYDLNEQRGKIRLYSRAFLVNLSYSL